MAITVGRKDNARALACILPLTITKETMYNLPDQRTDARPTAAQQFLLAAHRARAADIERQMDLLVLRSLVRDALDDVEAAA